MKTMHFDAKKGFKEGLLGVTYQKKYADRTIGEMGSYMNGYDAAFLCKIAAYGAGLTLLGLYLRYLIRS